MTTQQKLIKSKLNLLELGSYLGNVSEACRTLGYSRDTFYRLKKRYEEDGLEGLKFTHPPWRGDTRPFRPTWGGRRDGMRRLSQEEVVTIGVLKAREMPQREIARQLGVTEGSVRYRLRRAAEGAEDGRRHKPQRADAVAQVIEH